MRTLCIISLIVGLLVAVAGISYMITDFFTDLYFADLAAFLIAIGVFIWSASLIALAITIKKVKSG